MPLPIITTRPAPTPEDLVRLFHKTELNFTQPLGEETQLEVGTAITNPELPNVYDANRILYAALPEGVSPAEGVEEVEAHFATKGSRCCRWTLNPSAPPAQTEPLREHLRSLGYKPESLDILYLPSAPTAMLAAPPGLKVIPARASFKHYQQLAEEMAAGWGVPDWVPNLARAVMLHLDDPHWDALLAIRDRQPVAAIGVLAVGEIGRVGDLYVTRSARRQGLGRLMLDRAIEICSRSLFKHVFLTNDPANAAASALYSQFGFQKLSAVTSYGPPDLPAYRPTDS